MVLGKERPGDFQQFPDKRVWWLAAIDPNAPGEVREDLAINALCMFPKKILLAEDNPIMRQVIRQQLQKLGIQVDAVANGREAVEAVSQANYSLILMDCQMPEMTGLEATRAIRKSQSDWHHTPIIAVTSGGVGQEREDCIEAGMDDYLTKPVPLEQLQEVVTRWADKQQD